MNVVFALLAMMFYLACTFYLTAPKKLALGVMWLIINPAIYALGVPIGVLLAAISLFSIKLLTPVRISWTFWLAGLCVIQGASLLWSPSPLLAIQELLRTLLVLRIVLIALDRRVDTVMMTQVAGSVAGLVISLQAVSTVIFRLAPTLEEFYYRSSLASLLIGAQASGLYSRYADSNNVVDLNRAAGILYVNCNRASMVMGVYLLVAIALLLTTKDSTARLFRKLLWVTAITCVLGILAAGSKTGWTLLAIGALILISVRNNAPHRERRGFPKAALVFASLGAVATLLVFQYGSSYLSESRSTLAPRRELWAAAFSAISDSPVLGLGFGGWDQRWIDGAVLVTFRGFRRPPHNFLLTTWLDSGIASVAIVILFLASALIFIRRALRSAWTVKDMLASLAAALGICWIIVHGLGDNTTWFGVDATIPAWFLMIASTQKIASRAMLRPDNVSASPTTQSRP